MIAETIKILHSNNWYGCSEVIEMAKGKNSIPKTWQDVKKKIRRANFMQKAAMSESIEKSTILKRVQRWLLKKR